MQLKWTALKDELSELEKGTDVRFAFLFDEEGKIWAHGDAFVQEDNQDATRKLTALITGTLIQTGKRLLGREMERAILEFSEGKLFLLPISQEVVLAVYTHANSNLGMMLVSLSERKEQLVEFFGENTLEAEANSPTL